ncbi:hypothetical protein R3P38DRAFT_3265276 [Favolaschia claudopus]|uniref:Uncharacterized protein n=1 Tax=Favolaschia claudopus TaxID=2862362 RepID=A0AAW0C4B6_9AGAR
MPRLTAANKKAAKELAKELFEWDVTAEKQLAILRYLDQAEVAEAHAQLAKDKAGVGSLPPPDRMQECIAYAEQELQNSSTKILSQSMPGRLLIVANATFLGRVKLLLAGENDHFFTVEIMKHRVAMHTEYCTKYGFYGDPNVPRLNSAANINSSVNTAHDPVELPASDLSTEELQDAPQLKLGTTDVERFRQDLDSLLDLFFVSSSSGEEKFYQVSSIMAKKTGKSFYLTFADEGPDAVCYASDDFFALLTSSHQVMA